jgi:crotonobetainyl-CoA hydratase
MSDSVKTSSYDGVLEVVVDRPKANAIDNATSREMGRIFAEFRDDPNLRIAILTGGGEKFFSAGWDLKEAAAGQAEYEDDYGVGGFGGLQELPGLNKPVICAVNGMCVGGGFEIALACDILIAADHARFALPEINIGVLADAATLKLPKRVPHHVAMEMLLTGRWMPADEAKHWGLVSEVVPADQLMIRARDMARLLAGGPPLVFQCIKEVVRETGTLTTREGFDLLRSHSLKTYKAMLESEDAKEGPRAFAEKRPPKWTGR